MGNIKFIGQAVGGLDHMFEKLKTELQPSAGVVIGLRQSDGAIFGAISKGMTAAELAWLRAYTVRLIDGALDELMYPHDQDEDQSS